MEKRAVFFIPPHSMPILAPCELHVLCIIGKRQELVHSLPMLKEYTTDRGGVDVADRLRASYSCQVQFHKWWHHVFFFSYWMLQLSTYTLFTWIALHITWETNCPTATPMWYLHFKKGPCEALWVELQERPLEPADILLLLDHRVIHLPSHTSIRCLCVLSNLWQPYHYSYLCGELVDVLQRELFLTITSWYGFALGSPLLSIGINHNPFLYIIFSSSY